MTENPTCTHCGAPVSPAGRRSPTGERYCATRAECLAARARARRLAKTMARGGMEERPCSSCGAAMPIRAKRVTDSPLGRWCLRNRCQQARLDAMIAEDRRRLLADPAIAAAIAEKQRVATTPRPDDPVT